MLKKKSFYIGLAFLLLTLALVFAKLPMQAGCSCGNYSYKVTLTIFYYMSKNIHVNCLYVAGCRAAWYFVPLEPIILGFSFLTYSFIKRNK